MRIYYRASLHFLITLSFALAIAVEIYVQGFLTPYPFCAVTLTQAFAVEAFDQGVPSWCLIIAVTFTQLVAVRIYHRDSLHFLIALSLALAIAADVPEPKMSKARSVWVRQLYQNLVSCSMIYDWKLVIFGLLVLYDTSLWPSSVLIRDVSVGQAYMLCLVVVTCSACVGSIHPRRLPECNAVY